MQPTNTQVVYVGSSQYATYRVIDMVYNDRPARVLFGNGASPQSGMARDSDPEPLFEYNQRFLEIMLSQPPQKCLVIGGGVMMLPRAAYNLFPKLSIDVVELDPLLIEIARDYFDLPSNQRLTTHVADGLEFVKSTKTKYDTIIIDAFSGFTIPLHLVDVTAAEHYSQSLSRGGLVAVNLISEYRPGQPSIAHDMIKAFSVSFSHVKLYLSDPEEQIGHEQNLILVASNSDLALDYLQSEPIDL